MPTRPKGQKRPADAVDNAIRITNITMEMELPCLVIS